MPVIRNNPQLWESVKADLMADGKRWDARKAQRAVQLYKSMGGTYSGRKPTAKQNSLVKWTQEQWQYVEPNTKGRYLPKKIIEQMSPQLKKAENMKKLKDTSPNAPYSKALVKLMKKNKII